MAFFKKAFLVLFILLITPPLKANGLRGQGADASQGANVAGGLAKPDTVNASFLNPAGLIYAPNSAAFGAVIPFPTLTFGSSLAPAGNPEAVSEDGDLLIPILGVSGLSVGLLDNRLVVGFTSFAAGGVQADFDRSVIPSSITNDQYANAGISGNLKIIPNAAFRVHKKLVIGAGLDINYNFFASNAPVMAPGFPETSGRFRYDTSLGIGGRVGLIYEPLKWLNVGVSYIFRSRNQRFGRYRDILDSGIDLPQQLGVGLAFMPLKGMTIMTDFRWLNWNSGILGRSIFEGGFGWQDQYVGIFAFRYNFGPKYKVPITLRFGYNYGRSPITSAVAFSNLLVPAIIENSIGFGFGMEMGPFVGLDLGYVRQFENTVTDDGSLNPAGQGAFLSTGSHVALFTFRGYWGGAAKDRAKRMGFDKKK